MAKRKPPSQRPELKMDETAKAIARLREDAKAVKSSEPGRLTPEGSKPKMSRLGQNLGRRMDGIPRSPSIKRQKSGGS